MWTASTSGEVARRDRARKKGAVLEERGAFEGGKGRKESKAC